MGLLLNLYGAQPFSLLPDVGLYLTLVLQHIPPQV